MIAFNILIPLAVAGVVIVLALGLYNLMRGGNPNRSQSLMRMRILIQFIAVVLIVAALYIAGRG